MRGHRPWNRWRGWILRRYVYGPGTDEPLVWYEGSGTSDKRWLAADERGSVVAVTNASGAAIALDSYDEYGVPGSANLGRFQFTGQKWLAELGLYDYKARMYDPKASGGGRFLQTDPIGYADGPNWYGYVRSDPVNLTDPWGLGGQDLTVIAKPCPPGFHRQKDRGDALGCVANSLRPTQQLSVGGGGGGNSAGPVDDPAVDGVNDIVVTGVRTQRQPPRRVPCTPTAKQLDNSGRVTFRFSEAGGALGGIASHTEGRFVTENGYSGHFTTINVGAGVFFGGTLGYGTGSSRSLETFSGGNYNVIGQLGFYGISDNFSTNDLQHVGQTDAFDGPAAVGIGATYSYTKLSDVICPR